MALVMVPVLRRVAATERMLLGLVPATRAQEFILGSLGMPISLPSKSSRISQVIVTTELIACLHGIVTWRQV